MREDNRSREKFVDELLDAALSNHCGAEPENGLEDRVLAGLRRKSRAAHPISSHSAPVIIAMAVVLALFAVDHLIRQPASDATIAAVSMVDGPRGAGALDLAARQVKAGEREVLIDGAKFGKALALAPSSSRRRDFALNLNSRRSDEGSESGFRIEEAQISEIRLDDIVIGNNER